MNVEVFQVAANLCMEPKFSSGRHKPHSRLNDWHTIDYDDELFTDLSFCVKSSGHEVPSFTAQAPDFSVLKERNCSTSTPLVSKNSDKLLKVSSKRKGRLISLQETNDSCDSGYGETDVISTFASCTLHTPGSLNNGHQKCSNYDLESDCPIFLQPLPCVSLENLFDYNIEKESKQTVSKNEVVQIRTDSCDSGFESQNFGYRSQSNSNRKQDASFNEKIAKLLTKFSPENPEALIGRRIGEEHIDIVGLLHTKNIDPAVRKICEYLSDENLCAFRCVSQLWNSVVKNHSCLKFRWKKHVASKKKVPWSKENQSKKSPRKQTGLTEGKKTPLSSLQPTAKSKPSPASSLNIVETPPTVGQSTGPMTRHQLFVKAASNLKNGECLRKCPLCSSPSRTDSCQERAWCMGVRCKYDFCIKCRSPFHGSKPCTMGISKKTRTEGGGVGSKKSKKNLRRL